MPKTDPGEALVTLGFVTTNQPGPKVTDDGRYVILSIDDGASHQRVVHIELSANEFLRIMSGQTIRVTDGVRFTDHPERIGKQLDVHEDPLGRVDDTYAEQELRRAEEAIRAGTCDWDEVAIGRHNYGKSLHYRRWRDATA